VSLDTRLQEAFREQEATIPSLPGDLGEIRARGRRRRALRSGLAMAAVLSVLVVPIWLLGGDAVDGIVVEPADQPEVLEEDQQAPIETLTLVAPDGSRVELVVPDTLPTNSVHAGAVLADEHGEIASIHIDDRWPREGSSIRDGFPSIRDAVTVGERSGGRLWRVTAAANETRQVEALLWHGERLTAVIAPRDLRGHDLESFAAALTFEERDHGLAVAPAVGGAFADAVLTDVFVRIVRIRARTTAEVPRENLEVMVVPRTDATVAAASTDRGGSPLEPATVRGGQLYVDSDGRMALVTPTAVVRNDAVWKLGNRDLSDRMYDILTQLEATWLPRDP
jgi:hypothetical protein